MNLYAHFPFCRRKCAYCALYSRVGDPQTVRDGYVTRLAAEISRSVESRQGEAGLVTVYFGGGSPALCDLRPLLAAVRPRLSTSAECEFTVELHPDDVSEPMLETLRAGGVNRISMGVQSFDDATLTAMGRGYTIDDAVRAFGLVKRYFDNAGIDIIVGYPGDPGTADFRRFADLGLRHCSVYSLQNERGLADILGDDVILDRVKIAADQLQKLGLERYEISNYALPGYECRHNLAVWRGEDYVGIGEGAYGRIGRLRTRGGRNGEYSVETLSKDEDLKERTIFRLRTREGIDTSSFPEWRPILDRFVSEGLLTKAAANYRLTTRGTEVCDTILAEIV